ncbi:uncharacterized protein LOC115034965 [Acyrthosiphon pisum]|uniref:Uncharacterized protein n=1 Tax=Acyrthosiphon pisum TaxID=7029 RepID=A0A8R2JVH9_ACYPI|nr:uncharacterized protein LOC115034965 [Acyrthosiphon pisum]
MSDRNYESKGNSIIKRWLQKKKRTAINTSEEAKNDEDTYVADTRDIDGGTGRGNVTKTENVDSQISGPEGLGNGEHGAESRGGGSPFGFLRSFISVTGQSILSPRHSIDYFDYVPIENYGDSNESEAMDGQENTEYMGGEYDFNSDNDDDTISTYEEVYDDVVERLGRAMASKFVSGIHR